MVVLWKASAPNLGHLCSFGNATCQPPSHTCNEKCLSTKEKLKGLPVVFCQNKSLDGLMLAITICTRKITIGFFKLSLMVEPLESPNNRTISELR